MTQNKGGIEVGFFFEFNIQYLKLRLTRKEMNIKITAFPLLQKSKRFHYTWAHIARVILL